MEKEEAGVWAQPGDSLVPRYRLAQGCPSSHGAATSASPTTLPCYPSGPCLFCSSSNLLHPQSQIKLWCLHTDPCILSVQPPWKAREALSRSHYPKIGPPAKMPSPSQDHILSPNFHAEGELLHARSPLGWNSPCTGVWGRPRSTPPASGPQTPGHTVSCPCIPQVERWGVE